MQPPQPRALGWLEFPEDLGECRHGVPSSIWSWEKVLDLASLGYLRGAIYQCEWAPVDYRKPTGLLCNFSCLMRDPHISPGWPKFSSHEPDGKGKKYCGPLPNACMHGKHSYRLIGKGDDGCFKTSKTAAYPPEMCAKLAGHMVQALWDKPTARIQSVSPVVGAFVEVGLLFPMDLVESEATKVMNAAKALIPGDSGSLALGLHARPGDGSVSFSFSGNPNLLQELNAVVLEAVLRSGRSFPWSSLQLHRNVRSSPHSDSGIGTALLTVVGQFEGGEF